MGFSLQCGKINVKKRQKKMLAKRWDIALESERQREVLYIGNRELWIEKENLPPCC
jgi:hypothetical protein